jgi:hypothetical protein
MHVLLGKLQRLVARIYGKVPPKEADMVVITENIFSVTLKHVLGLTVCRQEYHGIAAEVIDDIHG